MNTILKIVIKNSQKVAENQKEDGDFKELEGFVQIRPKGFE